MGELSFGGKLAVEQEVDDLFEAALRISVLFLIVSLFGL